MFLTVKFHGGVISQSPLMLWPTHSPEPLHHVFDFHIWRVATPLPHSPPELLAWPGWQAACEICVQISINNNFKYSGTRLLETVAY